MDNKLKTISNLFEDKQIRSVWNSEQEDYYFSIVDVIRALTDSKIPRNYWSDLKRKLKEEGSQLHENIVQLKMKSNKDGKNYLTDTLDTKGILRLIESVPSPKAEPFKLWLASLGKGKNVFYHALEDKKNQSNIFLIDCTKSKLTNEEIEQRIDVVFKSKKLLM